jgi:hypothetical protein
MSRFIALPALALCLLAAVLFLPSLLRERDLVASTPSPRPLFNVTPITVAPGPPLCLNRVTIPHDARQVRFQVITGGRPGPPLRVTLSADAYAQRASVAAGYADETTLSPAIAPPPQTRLGRVCITNGGTAPIALTGSGEERTQSRPEGTIDGRPVAGDAYLAFYEARTGSALSQTRGIIARMGAFRPGVVGPWLLWPLLVLVLVGVPGGLVWALHRASQ